ncbi:MAG: GDSL-type esterase/lipase family protein [Planctomycetota bacterium]
MRIKLIAFLVALIACASLHADRRPPAKTMHDGDFEVLRYWQVTPKDAGTIKSVSGKENVHSGEHAARIEIGPTAKKPVITLYGSSKNSETVYPGEAYVLSFWMRGKGKATLAVIEYGRKDEEGKEPQIAYLGGKDLGQPVDLTDQWQEIKGEYKAEKDAISYVAPCVRLEGEGAWALVDDASFVEKPTDVSLEVEFSPRVASVGEFFEYRIKVGGAKEDATVNMLLYDPHDFLKEKASKRIGKDGIVQDRLRIPDDAEGGIHLFHFSVAGSGPSADRVMEIMPKEIKEQVLSLAKKVTFKKPEKLVFVGDSLTDLFRGRNYVDKVDLYLRTADPGEFEVVNAGVGGDMITRVADRLEKDVIAIKPTHVFIFLGHNDSKVAWPEYTKHACEVDVFSPTYRDVIKQIKEKTDAKVTIMSATSSVWEICKETADKRAAEKKPHNLFGKPSELELYNKLARQVGDEFGCDYIDLYTPLKDIPDKRNYFTTDGVHISEKGNRLVAIEILKYLAGSKN